MLAAVRAYDRYRRGEHAWMLSAFVVPSSRLDELAEAIARAGAASLPWPVSVLTATCEDPVLDLVPDGLRLRTIEIGPVGTEGIRAGKGGLQHFYEVPLDDRMDVSLDAIAEFGAAAKVRTGGVEARAFPTAERLAQFIHGCAERRLPFKATAGLHHPVRGRYALTYERDSPRCEMFGFLEVALVAALLWHRRIDGQEAAALLEKGSANVELASGAIAWAGHGLEASEIAEVRRSFFRSFGSCSFEDPVTDLVRLGVL
jgi:hypothetical protein